MKQVPTRLFNDIEAIIDSARSKLALEFNQIQILLNWHIGRRINIELLNDRRGEYGKQIINNLSLFLKTKYGRGFDKTSLSRMIKFAKLYTDESEVILLSDKLSWSHVIKVIAISDDLKRDYYVEMCKLEGWDVRTFADKIRSMLYERTAVSKKPEKLVREEVKQVKITQKITPNFVFRDPYFLSFTGLSQNFSESDLENAILDELEDFLKELGSDFCFVARQKRMSTASKDRYLDLLFFHRSLRRLIAIELKIGDFEPSYKGQMEWYLNWLDKNERKQFEEKPLGIILCANKDEEDVEYLELDASGIHVAQFLTELPPPDILGLKLREAVASAREKQSKLETEAEIG